MDHLTPEAIEALIRRHAAGDRSPGLMKALDQAAFACFHAPWETYPGPPKAPVPRPQLPTQGYLPIELPEDEPGHAIHDLAPEEGGPGAAVPVGTLAAGLKTLGLHPFVFEDRAVQVNLVLDQETDCTCLLQFAVNPEEQAIKVRVRSDMMYSLSQESLLPRLRTRWNQEDAHPRAVLRSTHEGGRLRLELALSFPLALLEDLEEAAPALRTLVSQVQAFWRFVRLGLSRKPLT